LDSGPSEACFTSARERPRNVGAIPKVVAIVQFFDALVHVDTQDTVASVSTYACTLELRATDELATRSDSWHWVAIHAYTVLVTVVQTLSTLVNVYADHTVSKITR
jgi:hypothetical protein